MRWYLWCVGPILAMERSITNWCFPIHRQIVRMLMLQSFYIHRLHCVRKISCTISISYNWSVNFYWITPFHFGKARLFPLHVTVCGKPCDRLRQKPRQTRWVILSVRSAEWLLWSGFVEQCCSCVQWRSYICAKFW